MHTVLIIAGGLFLALGCVGAIYALAASVLVGRFGARSAPRPIAAWPSVSILKPLHGDEPGLRGNLQTFLDQNYPAPVQLVLGLQDAGDSALPIAEALRAANPERVSLVVDAREHGLNRKVSNLINLTAQAHGELFVQSDSDISVTPDYLRRIVAGFDDPAVGLVTSLYVGEGRAGAWSRFAAMNLAYGFLPSVVVGVSLGLARPCMGSTIALRRTTLERIGGFEAVKDLLADDYEIGRLVRETGLHTILAPGAVVHACSETRFAEVWRHELRWALTVREIDPAGFYGSVVTHALPLGLIGAAILGFPIWSWAVVAAILLVRFWLQHRVDKVFGVRAGPWWMTPGRDIVSFVVLIGAVFAGSVDWRGSRYQVTRGGRLKQARSPG